MSPFITFRDTDSNGELTLFVLQRDYPHFVGVLATYPSGKAVVEVPISGHNLYMRYYGTLRGNFIPLSNHIDLEMESVFHAMALWFYSERIMKDPKRYKKWAIPVPSH